MSTTQICKKCLFVSSLSACQGATRIFITKSCINMFKIHLSGRSTVHKTRQTEKCSFVPLLRFLLKYLQFSSTEFHEISRSGV